MVIEIALGIVLAVIILALLPLAFVLAWYLFLFALALAFVALIGWGAYELYQAVFPNMVFTPLPRSAGYG